MTTADVPAGYVSLQHGRARAVVRSDAAEAVHRALSGETLHGFAARHPQRRELRGRGTAYAVPLDETLRVVVRHNTHGGLLARLTGDRFLAPTRAPRELSASLKLLGAGIATPPVIAIVRYAAGGPLERSDVATAEIPGAADLAAILAGPATAHAAAAAATGALLAGLGRACAHHEDLNIKNILLQATAEGFRAFVLDVDRVTFGHRESASVMERNWRRFARSARKWHTAGLMAAGERWLDQVQTACLESQELN